MFPVEGVLRLLEKEQDFVFLETAKYDVENYLSYIFLRPERIISTSKIEQLENKLTQLDKALKDGYYAAGFLAYEAGSAFEERLRKRQVFDFPLLWFGMYKEPLIYNHRKEAFARGSAKAGALIKEIILSKDDQQKNYRLKNIRANISQQTYLKAIAEIKDLIAQGLTYQVNYTFKLKFSFTGSAAGLYLNLRNNQSVPYAAFIKTEEHNILSFSPELFFRKNGRAVLVRPMKGTSQRGRDLTEDTENAQRLRKCLKNRSENVMIVDLLRNDLGRVSSTASVRVPHLFNLERYQTLFQMTSDIKSKLKVHYSAFELFKHIFPSGSVTGAPKIKTMEIISQLEQEPRSVYTGSIGFFAPNKSGTFNVAIRTLVIDNQTKTGEMGVGSGIVYDSRPKNEYDECRLKADFLIKQPQDFQLIETMLWRPHKGYTFLELHLSRLKKSAEYFDFIYKRQELLTALKKLQKQFKKSAYRVRLLLDKGGKIQLEPALLKLNRDKKPKIYLSTKKTSSGDIFLYHKTTNRRLYNQEYQRCQRAGFDDVLFTNEKGEITEGAVSNIFVRKNGTLYTPPKTCGLLDGVYRRWMFNSGKFSVQEKILFKEDLLNANEIYLSNSVRGLVRVELETKNH